MVGFDDTLSKKSNIIGASAIVIDLPNGKVIIKLNKNQLLHGGENYLLSTAHAHEFGPSIHDVAKQHGEKQYIHDDNRVIPMKFYKALMYVPI